MNAIMNRTKAQMLKYLKENLTDIHVLPIYILDSDAFFADQEGSLLKIKQYFHTDLLIVRSSSKAEDTATFSNAGKFKSLLHVLKEEEELSKAIKIVYQSYDTAVSEEILIQPMLKNIMKSGVVFTTDINTGAPYYTVNYEEGGGSEAVTSGTTNKLKTFVSYKHSFESIEDADMKKLIDICGKIEAFLAMDSLDIEFAIDFEHKIYILQVRPIAKGHKENDEILDIAKSLDKIYKKVNKLNGPHPFLLGRKTCFGVMPDWNPAEILGVRPKKLAITLYKELITDYIWANQRDHYGYRNLMMHPLMVLFCGIPYIDTRITLNSFIPKVLPDSVADKLANYYIESLEKYPAYHDKIEFKIVHSCYYFGIEAKLNFLLMHGFHKNEIEQIKDALLELTNNVVHPQKGFYKQDIALLIKLEESYHTIVNADISLVDKIYWLIEKCKIYGTLPFAGVARSAFVAVQFLKSFVEINILTEKEYHLFLNSLNTVSKSLNKDLEKLSDHQITKEQFITKYGHIRPGTYDIMSYRYDENFESYFAGYTLHLRNKDSVFNFTGKQLEKIQAKLDESGFDVTAQELIQFIVEAIEGREYVKFIFSKSVSEILRQIEILGKRLNISRDDLAHLDILQIKSLYSDLNYDGLRNILMEVIEKNKKQFKYAKQIKLPSIIVNPQDVYHYFLLDEEPNFIGLGNVEGDVLTEERIDVCDCKKKIIFIKSADPGYDFLFTKEISGLVTQFGGANSHMAIRCAELGIPAIIGAGEKNYLKWSGFKRIRIDCLKKQAESVIYF